MGSVRLLLAIAVVFTHSYGFMFVGGRTAVQMFYMISGFLISFILVELNSYPSKKSFYINRILRLYPIYIIVAVISFSLFSIFAISGHDVEFFSTLNNLPPRGKLALIISNITLFGQDWVMFTGVRDGNFQFVSDTWNNDIQIWHGLLVPQAWTLGVEISFYLIAPFILHNKRIIFALLVLSLSIRAYLILIGIGLNDPWTYRFFPAELALFLFGALSHQIVGAFLRTKRPHLLEKWSTSVSIFIFVYCLVLFALPIRGAMTLLLMGLFLLSLPFLFYFQNQHNWDRKIGDLSYPVYISHMLIIWPLTTFISRDALRNNLPLALGIVVVTLVVSIILNRLVEKPINRMRSRIRANV